MAMRRSTSANGTCTYVLGQQSEIHHTQLHQKLPPSGRANAELYRLIRDEAPVSWGLLQRRRAITYGAVAEPFS